MLDFLVLFFASACSWSTNAPLLAQTTGSTSGPTVLLATPPNNNIGTSTWESMEDLALFSPCLFLF